MFKTQERLFTINFLFGGLAGITSKTICAPIERVKLLLQTQYQNKKLKVPYKGIIDCFQRCISEEGFLSLWRGNGINVIRYFPTQALNFSFKDYYGHLFKVRERKSSKVQYVGTHMICGGMAGSTTCLFVHPLDFARTRLGVDMGKQKMDRQFKGLKDCLSRTYAYDGIRGLYRGLLVATLSIFVYRGLYFGIYDAGKQLLLNSKRNLFTKWLWAQFSVILAEVISYPGDTIKRKLFMQNCSNVKEYNGMVQCFTKIVKRQGILGLWKGSLSNILRGIGSSLCLVFYDQLKYTFSKP